MLLVAVPLFAALVLVAEPSIAQDKGKTAAAELTSRVASSPGATSSVPLAKTLESKAYAVLVFPEITKAGFGIGGQYGEGTLLKAGKAAAYYKTTGASFGLQAGGQQYGYAMFFMNEKALAQLDNAKGFEVGVGPSVVMVDEGMAKTTNDHNAQRRYLCLCLRTEGADGGSWHPGQQNLENPTEIE